MTEAEDLQTPHQRLQAVRGHGPRFRRSGNGRACRPHLLDREERDREIHSVDASRPHDSTELRREAQRIRGHQAEDGQADFDPRKKYTGDDYYNYYATLRSANQRKRGKEKKHEGAAFFTSGFFQNREELTKRLRCVPQEFVYEAVEGDREAADLIDYLGLNDHELCEQRRAHARRLGGIFGLADYDRESRLKYLRAHKAEQSFTTALETELDLDLSSLLEDTWRVVGPGDLTPANGGPAASSGQADEGTNA